MQVLATLVTGSPTATPATQVEISASNPLPVSLSAAVPSGATAPKYALISSAASGDNSLVALVASKKIRVLSYVIVADAGVVAKFRSATTDITGAMALSANGGVSAGFNPYGHFETAAGVALNLNLGAAIGVRGHLTYLEV